MKNFIFTIIAIIIIAGISFSQWIPQNSGSQSNINTIDFFNVNTGWAAGENSKVYRTTNGGLNWITITIPGNPVNITNSVSKDIAYLAGTRNTIYTTTNNGANWYTSFLGQHYKIGNMISCGSSFYISAYLMYDNEDSVLSADVFRSNNNGINWVQISSITMANYGNHIHGVDVKLGLHFVSDDTAYIATKRGIYKTVNRGLNFVLLQDSPASPRVVVAGSNSLSSSTTFFVGIDMPNKLEIYKRADAGDTWILLNSIPDPNDTKTFTGISAPDNTGKIYLTIANVNTSMSSVQDTSVYFSPNNGADWYYHTLPVNNITLSSIDFIDGNTGYISGSNGTILKTTNGGQVIGIQQTSHELPESYLLHQNFPNPFNPVTHISFDIPVRGHVKLSVYNIAGSEIALLVNNELLPGTYNTEWNASEFSSGIYFCRLETSGFIQTKKIMLVK